MEVSVSSQHAEVSNALREAAVEKIGRLDRFLDGMERAEIHFVEERNPRIAEREVCEVTMEGHGRVVRVKVAARDQFSAIDLAVEKLEQRLSRLKTRLVGRTRPRHPGPQVGVIDQEELPAEAEDALRIVKVKSFDLEPMTADEATFQMELLGHEFFLFASADTGRPSVVYRRADGDVGLIEQSG